MAMMLETCTLTVLALIVLIMTLVGFLVVNIFGLLTGEFGIEGKVRVQLTVDESGFDQLPAARRAGGTCRRCRSARPRRCAVRDGRRRPGDRRR